MCGVVTPAGHKVVRNDRGIANSVLRKSQVGLWLVHRSFADYDYRSAAARVKQKKISKVFLMWWLGR